MNSPKPDPLLMRCSLAAAAAVAFLTDVPAMADRKTVHSPGDHHFSQAASHRDASNNYSNGVFYYYVIDNHGKEGVSGPVRIIPPPGVPGAPQLMEDAKHRTYLPFSSNYFPNDKNRTGNDGYGFVDEVGGTPDSGSLPQSALPLGAFGNDARTTVAEVRDEMMKMVNLLDTPAGSNVPAAQVLQDSVHDRDVRIAAKSIPKIPPPGRESKG